MRNTTYANTLPAIKPYATHAHGDAPMKYSRMTDRSTAASPTARTNRYIVVSPLNSTPLPAPLFTVYSIGSKEEGTEDCRRNDQEDAGEKPRGGCLGRVRVAAGELAVGLYAAYEAEHRADGVTQLGCRVEVRGHEAGCFVYSGQPLALGGSRNCGRRSKKCQ